MSIKKYTNFEKINLKTENEGKFIQEKDNFIISQNQIEESDFGECEHDVMEVSVYDINNNILPQTSGNMVAYIKSGDIKHYLYSLSVPNIALPDGFAKKELAIDVEKLLNDLGFTNGILRININFVRNRVGDDNEYRRAYIQEISATKNEIRILPLKTFDTLSTSLNENEFYNLSNLNKDFKWYKKEILDSLYSFDSVFLQTINSYLETKYGTAYFTSLRTDFGLSDFDSFARKIYDDFTKSVDYYLNNKYYDVRESHFGMKSPQRFDECERYDFNMVIKEMETILYNCIEYNSYFLKRRDFSVLETPKEFTNVTLSNAIYETQNILPGGPTKPINLVFNPQQAPVQPSEPKPIIVQQPPVQPVVIPTQINVNTSTAHYTYSIKNNSSTQTVTFTFMDVTGTTVQKYVAPGVTINVCAKEGSLSITTPTNLGPDDVPNSSPRAGILDNPVYWSIARMNLCNTLDISSTAPTPVSTNIPAGANIPLNPVVVPPAGGYPIIMPQPAPINTGCFVEGTMITLANGTKLAIEEVTTEMEVLTWNEDTGKKEVGIVKDLIRPISSDIISIEYGTEMIECTAEHPFFIIGKGWSSYNPSNTEIHHGIKVHQLEVGDLVLNSNDETVSIDSITPINVLIPIQTYNLSIEGNHTYYANDILVHNKLASNGATANSTPIIGGDILSQVTSTVTAQQIGMSSLTNTTRE